jgi:hypothetical protein
MVAKVKKKVADKHRKDKKNAKKDITWKSSQYRPRYELPDLKI